MVPGPAGPCLQSPEPSGLYPPTPAAQGRRQGRPASISMSRRCGVCRCLWAARPRCGRRGRKLQRCAASDRPGAAPFSRARHARSRAIPRRSAAADLIVVQGRPGCGSVGFRAAAAVQRAPVPATELQAASLPAVASNTPIIAARGASRAPGRKCRRHVAHGALRPGRIASRASVCACCQTSAKSEGPSAAFPGTCSGMSLHGWRQPAWTWSGQAWTGVGGWRPPAACCPLQPASRQN